VIARDEMPGAGDETDLGMRSQTCQPVDVLGGERGAGIAVDEQERQAELRGDLLQARNLREDVLDDLGEAAE